MLRADRIKSKLDEVSADVDDTWRTAQTPSQQAQDRLQRCWVCKVCTVSTFCQFFAEKVNCIRDNTSDTLGYQLVTFAVRLHHGPEMSSFQASDSWRKSDGYCLQCHWSHRRLTYCRVLYAAEVITTLANLSLQSGKFPFCYKKVSVLPLLKKLGLQSSSPANYRPISNMSTVSKVLERLVLTRLRPHLLGSASSSQLTFHRNCTARDSRQRVHGSKWQAGQSWSASTCQWRLTQSTTVNYLNGCSRSSELQERCWLGSSRSSRAGLGLSSWVYISHQS